mgnify:CR=1 FL=1|tara:strand:- start:713 stop:883 length:171 start_codon:yes stop_codon:yes gene_type:complete
MKTIKEHAIDWLQANQCIVKDLINEFHQLRYDDYDFHEQYRENEFIHWIIDYELTN